MTDTTGKLTSRDRFEDFLRFGVLPFAFLGLMLVFPNELMLLFAVVAFPIFTLLAAPKRFLPGKDLSLGGIPVVSMLSLSLLFGHLTYVQLQKKFQNDLYEATAGVDILGDLCARVPGLVQAHCIGPELSLTNEENSDAKRSALSDMAIWSLLRDAGILKENDFPDPSFFDRAEEIDRPTALTVNFLRDPSRRSETSYGLILALTSPCGFPASPDDEREQARATERALAFTFADLQSHRLSAKDVRMAGDGAIEKLAEDRGLRLYEFSPKKLVNIASQTDAFRNLRDLERLAIPKPWRDEEVLTALLASGDTFSLDSSVTDRTYIALQTGAQPSSVASYEAGRVDADGNFSTTCTALLERARDTELTTGIPGTGAGSRGGTSFEIDEPQELFEALLQREALALYAVGRLRTADSIRDERFWLTLVTGYEQYAMIFLFIFGLFIALFRIVSLGIAWLERDLWFTTGTPKPGDMIFLLRSSRWPIKLIAAILPGIGFIGTVRGIMLSLTGADQIVWATTVNERSAAISALSTDLGLAFATTLIALLLGVILSLLLAVEQRVSEVAVAASVR